MALFTQLSRVDQRIADLPWPDLLEQLDRDGFAQTPTVYTPEECRRLSALFDDDGRFRSTIEMRRHRFGECLDRCHDAGQHRTTPLLLRYGAGGHNTLHQDLYGEVAFPLQAVTVLDRPGIEFDGGQFVLLEQRPRAQSRAHVIDLRQGAFLLFPTRHRPVHGTRGFYRSPMKHGVATVQAGQRTTLGVIFHDAA